MLAPLAALALVVSASAQVTFSFNYLDSGTGFNDVTLGATRRSALESAASTLASYFSVPSARTVTFDVTSHSTNNTNLASAGSTVSGITVDGFYKTNAQKMIQDNAGPGDGQINWNFFHAWDYDDSVGAGSYDFKSVAMHEMIHALGFFSFVSGSETGAFDEPSGNTDVWSIFDQFLTDASGTRLVTSGAAFNTSLAGIIANASGAAGDVYFNGTNAVATFGGVVPIYSPATFADGSSLSHLSTTFFGTNNYIMTHAVTTGPSVRALSALELAILSDLGYSVTAVPEPATYAALAGCLALVVAVRRRRAAA
ncbi:MAG TPA: PEP-CTERM sorting domain-containing protein [Opitutaceae bacterium]|nr:PEP-CTERM sorting domain-containing protein [Opitutaceae bacterium]